MFDAISSQTPRVHPRGFVRFTGPERMVFRESENLDPAAWAEKYRVVAEGNHAGPWSHANSPYTVGPMRAYHLPYVREVFLCWGPQTGKTEVLLNCFGCFTVQDPALSMIIQPDENKAALFLDRRVKKTIEKTPALASIFFKKKDYHLLFQNGAEAIGAWAGSATALSSEAAKRVFADEFDKYPTVAGREISPVEASRARMITYPDTSKLLGTSTPNEEDGNMDQVMKEEADEIRHYYAVCPKCGTEQRIDHNRFEWPKGATRQEIIRHKLARYLCVDCAHPWDDASRDAAVLAGLQRNQDGWKSETPKERPSVVVFQLPGWYSPNVSLSKAAGALIKARKGSRDAKKIWVTQYKAEPFRSVESVVEDSEILLARCANPPQVIPEAAVALTCGVDMQKDGFWFVVRAWDRAYTSWMIHYGHLPTWEDLEVLLFKTTYPHAGQSGLSLPIWRAALDTGGGRYDSGVSMTEAAYLWLNRNRSGRGCRVFPTKGASRPQATKIRLGRSIEQTPGGKPLAAGLRLLMLDTGAFKDMVFYRLAQARENSPEAAYLHAETAADYSKQITAEVKKDGRWELLHKNNHLLDAECGAMAMADSGCPGGGVHLVRSPVDSAPVHSAQKPAPVVARSKFIGGGGR